MDSHHKDAAFVVNSIRQLIFFVIFRQSQTVMKKYPLVILAALLTGVMSYQIVATSTASNLFELMAKWGDPSIDPYPWFEATLWDFYGNFVLIALFVWHKENRWYAKLLWIVFLAALGSPGTGLYLLIQALKLKPEQGLKELFTKNGAA
ncbi:MAG TPA: DUF1475 family protein [Luteibaculaceae bacterium]|nr:DUF1475 family protein [Luteibaculaceae bacterium]